MVHGSGVACACDTDKIGARKRRDVVHVTPSSCSSLCLFVARSLPDFDLQPPLPLIMTKWQEFLAEDAKFPFPKMVEDGNPDTSDISPLEFGLVAPEWRAQYAVRDETLVPNLCQTLEDIVGDAHLQDENKDWLLQHFGDRLQFHINGGKKYTKWRWSRANDGKPHVRI